MASTMITTHYAHAPQQSVQYGYMPPPSPPMDESAKCSLPSISNLLGVADQGSPTSEASFQQQQQQQQRQQQQQQCMSSSWWITGYGDTDPAPAQQTAKLETRPSSSHYGNPVMRAGLPPSPPMSSDASFEGFNSPSTRSVSQVPTGSNYYFEATPPLQLEADARQLSTAATVPRASVQTSTSYQPQFTGSAYISQSAIPSYYPPIQAAAPPQTQMSGLYYQRALPQVSRGDTVQPSKGSVC